MHWCCASVKENFMKELCDVNSLRGTCFQTLTSLTYSLCWWGVSIRTALPAITCTLEFADWWESWRQWWSTHGNCHSINADVRGVGAAHGKSQAARIQDRVIHRHHILNVKNFQKTLNNLFHLHFPFWEFTRVIDAFKNSESKSERLKYSLKRVK